MILYKLKILFYEYTNETSKQYIHDVKIGIQCSTEALYINEVQDAGIRMYINLSEK